jgi:hypothetical protein
MEGVQERRTCRKPVLRIMLLLLAARWCCRSLVSRMSLSKCGAADIRRLVCSTMREAVKRVKNEGIVSTGEAAGQE